MNILPNAKWIECKPCDIEKIADVKNPWADIEYSPRPKDFERQFKPIDNQGGCGMFRRVFNCKKQDNVKITVTSLGIYNLWCNGKRVGVRDADGNLVYDEFNPGFTVYCKRVMATTYDLSEYIRDGENVILAVVAPGWWEGRLVYGTYGTDKGRALCAEIDVNGKIIATDALWQTFWGGRVRAADFYAGELYDATFPSYEEISSLDFDTSDWVKPEIWTDKILLTVPTHRSPEFKTHIDDLEIVRFTGPEVRIRKHLSRKPVTVTIYDGVKDNGSDYGEINVVRTYENSDSFVLKKGESAVIDFGQEIVAIPDILLKAEKGTYMQIKVAEMLNDSGLISRGNDNPKGSVYTINYRDARSKAYYVANGDECGERYRSLFTFFGFRYLEITATDDINIRELTALVVGSEIDETGSVETSHKDVNKLISNVLWGQRSNFLSIPTDCPQRDERQGWTGDTEFFCNTAAYNADVLEFFRKWLTDARDSQHPNGCYHDVIPIVNGWGGGGAAWADAPLIVGQVMWRMYADRTIIEENIDAFDKYMDWIATFGLRGPNPSYGDWLSYEPTAREYISKGYYAWDAQIMTELHTCLGNLESAKKYAELYDAIKADFISSYIGEDGDLLEEYRTQTGYLLALHVGIFEGEECKRAADRLEKLIIKNGYKLSTGFVGTAILCKTLAKFGKNNIAYSLLLQTEDPSWLYSVHQGATTIWERWNSYTLEKGFGDVGMNSFNHYSFGAVMEWIYRYVAGIEFDVNAPGFERVILQPKPDLRAPDEIPEGQEKISWVKGRYNSRKGLIISEWGLVDGVFRYYAETPVSATLYLPIVSDKKSFTLNGKEINVEDVKVDGELISVSLESGKYIVEY